MTVTQPLRKIAVSFKQSYQTGLKSTETELKESTEVLTLLIKYLLFDFLSSILFETMFFLLFRLANKKRCSRGAVSRGATN